MDENLGTKVTEKEVLPKRTTRKAVAKEAAEPKEAPVTPSRRSTRIRSNKSILAETTQAVESPRAKRALRRNSVLDSDNESAVTPARQTRRTRKNSTPSIDKPARSDNGVIHAVTSTNVEPINEESELGSVTSNQDSNATKGGNTDLSPSTRKSPRLQNKTTDIKPENEHQENTIEQSPSSNKQQESQVTNQDMEAEKNMKNTSPFTSDEKLEKPDTGDNAVDKGTTTTAAMNETTPTKSPKRSRTKSWTTLTSPQATGFNSDNSRSQEMIKCGTPNKNVSGSGDALLINDDSRNIIEAEIKSPNKSRNKTMSQFKIFLDNKENLVSNTKTTFQINKDDTVELFQNSPNIMQPFVLIEDLDSGSVGKPSIDIQMDVEDQCVPIVLNPGTNESPKKTSESCEPMDIDESMPINVTIDDFSEKSNSSKEEIELHEGETKDNNKSGKKPTSTSFQQNTSKRDSICHEQNKNESITLVHNSNKNSPRIDARLNGKANDIIEKSGGSSKNKSITALNSSNKSPKLNSYQQSDDDGEFIKISNKSNRKSSNSIGDQSIEKLNTSSNKSKRKSSLQTNSEIMTHLEENEARNNARKTNLNTSVSQSVSQNLEKSANENKSALVISQLNNQSSRNDSNHVMSPNVTNNELSKSLNQVSTQIKEIDKKNSSLNYLTSTPIQQKSLQKLTMQINSSLISPNVEIGHQERTPKKNISLLSSNSKKLDELENVIEKRSNKKSISVTSDSEEKLNRKQLSKSPNKKEATDSSDSSDDESKTHQAKPVNKKTPIKKAANESNKNLTKQAWSSSDSSDDSEENIAADKSKIFNDEASDAGDDYESGDSLDDEERKYAKENEIVHKGTTLDSEEDYSDDSEYEKDSFIVSSEAEDEEMLSGTGDDLAFSDNELTMSAKSKKKFNKRKEKEQKKASREMYEARHNIDKSNSITKSNKLVSKNSQNLSLESENEETESKKKNRRRIDSSPDMSEANSDADESIKIKKKKTKRLSDSLCENTEKEISICNQSKSEKKDPLMVSIKQEPKTPMKNFNISTVAITEGMEEVIVNDASIVKPNDTIDPLQATMAADEDSSSSDNQEIIQNYDSVLNNLNLQSTKIKTVDTSLSLNKKTKFKQAKQPVINELNLTVTKGEKSKKNENKSSEKALPVESSKPQGKDSKIQQEDDSDNSDSINMKLLFPEDSNDSELLASQSKPEINDASDEFIPLKRTEAKTNIPGKIDLSVSLNDSTSKKNKTRKSSLCIPDEVPNNDEDLGFKIIMDTTGTHEAIDKTMTQSSSAKKKKKNKNKSVIIEESTEDRDIGTATEVDCTDGVAENRLEIFSSEKKKKKKKKDKNFDVSLNNLDSQIENADNTVIEEMPANVSIKSDKQKNKTDVSANYISMEDEPIVATQTLSAKKKPKKISMSAEDVESQSENTELNEVPAEASIKSDKKKKKNKNKKISQAIVDNAGDESDDAPLEVSFRSEKKGDEADTVLNEEPMSSLKKNKKKNKKKKKDKESQSFQNSGNIENMPSTEPDVSGSKKRKRTASGNALIETKDAANDIPVESISTSNEKKKRKVHLDDEYIQAYNETNEHESASSSNKSKKKKSKNHDTVDEMQDAVLQQNPKKRKDREDDNVELISKVPKENSFDNILIPRLPEAILNQLDDKPKNKTRKMNPAVISTEPFVVENTKRKKNKPSNYLEQSVYLNDDDQPPKTKKRKRSKHSPKVLPFMPTALTSDAGYTSKFNINVIPRETQFVAQASSTENFKQNFLDSQRIKKFKTLQHCKSLRSYKLTKF